METCGLFLPNERTWIGLVTLTVERKRERDFLLNYLLNI